MPAKEVVATATSFTAAAVVATATILAKATANRLAVAANSLIVNYGSGGCYQCGDRVSVGMT